MPRKTVLELTKLLAESDEPVNIGDLAQAAFSFGTVELVSKLIDGKFPDYPRDSDRAQEQAAGRARAAAPGAAARRDPFERKFRGVRWVLADGSLKIVSSNAEQEEAHEELEVDYSGDSLDIGFNVNYLLDVLNNVPARGSSAHSATRLPAR